MKYTIIVFAFFLLTCCSFEQTSNLDCTNLKFGDFVADNPQDSIYVFRDFSSWYEMNTQNGFRNIFTIIWTDDCNFSLVFKESSTKDKSLNIYNKNDTLLYKTVSHSPTSITFSVTSKTKTYQQTLLRQSELDVWDIMLTRDIELKNDSLFTDGIEELFPDSIRKNLPNLKQQVKIVSFNQDEVEQVEYVLSLLKKCDINPIYSIASDDFKTLVSTSVLADYNEYLKNTYGKLMSYSVNSIPLSIELGDLSGGVVFNNASEYVLDATFENVKGNVQITVGLKNDNIYKIQNLNVQAGKNTRIPFIQSLTKDFWSNLKDKEFKKIYNGSAQILKNKAAYEQLKNMLSLIESYGELDNYTLSSQNFSIEEGQGFVTAQYLLDKDNKKALVTLSYIKENGNYNLAGIFYNQK